MTFDVAAEAALIASLRQISREEILPRFRALDPSEIATKTRADDLVTVADRRSEERLTEAVARILPGAVTVGEEAVSADPGVRDLIDGADLAVIVDPVDGTWNFAMGIPAFGVILSVAERGETVWGLIYDPLLDDWIVARKGGGARFVRPGAPDRALRLGPGPARIADINGMVHTYLFYGDERRRLFDRLPDFQRTGNLRCSAHEYRTLAQGGTDFVLSPSLNPWDHAAGCLIVEEAGGVARLLDGTPYRPGLREGRLLTARSEPLWRSVADAFSNLGPNG